MMLSFLFALATVVVRTYHPATVAQLSAGRVTDTHVEVVGCVSLVKREEDGDRHIRITEGNNFIVAECIPALPCASPKVGDRIKVRGVSRHDGKHKWYEVHPVEQLTVVGRCRE